MNKLIPCIKCNIEKPLSAFYDSTINRGGDKGRCKPCVRTRANDNHKQPHRVAYFSSEAGKRYAANKFYKYLVKYPNRHAARLAVSSAIERGYLVRATNYEKCGVTTKTEAHHDDYNKHLEVRWLCKKCHWIWHHHNTPIYQTH